MPLEEVEQGVNDGEQNQAQNQNQLALEGKRKRAEASSDQYQRAQASRAARPAGTFEYDNMTLGRPFFLSYGTVGGAECAHGACDVRCLAGNVLSGGLCDLKRKGKRLP